MPVAAVAPAVMAVGMAAAAPSTFAIIGAVGAVAGAVGTLTGVKELSIAGSALGAVGGLGAMASSAGLFGTGGLFGSAEGAAGATSGAMISDSAASVGAAPAQAGMTTGPAGMFPSVGDLISGKGFDTDVLSMVSRTTPPADVTLGASVTSPTTDQFGKIIPQGAGEGGSLGTVENPARPKGLIGTVGADDVTSTGIQSVAAAPFTRPDITIDRTSSKQLTAAEAAQPIQKPAAPEGLWGSLTQWIEKNPSAAMMGVSAIGSFLSGAFDPKSGAEKEVLEAQAERTRAETGLINQRRDLMAFQQSNMQAPIPVATRTRTNTGTGLINRGAA